MIFSDLQSIVLRAIDTAPVRVATRVLGATVLICVFLSAQSRGAEAIDEVHSVSGESLSPLHTAESEDGLPAFAREKAEIARLTKTGLEMWKIGDFKSAERAFGSVLNMNAPAELKKPLLLKLVEVYDSKGESMKVASILEKYMVLFPTDPDLPEYLMRLGLIYRELGAIDLATEKFFRILNVTMNSSPGEVDEHRRTAMKARLEIAETFDAVGKRDEARKYYAHLQVLDLEPADRERVHFRGAQLQFELEHWDLAAKELARFLEKYPESKNLMEARYLYAKSLDHLERTEEAVAEVLAILQNQDSNDPAKADETAYWRRRTGNELANKLYERGDFIGALSVYQALARASEAPAWRWPAVYQVGLCFERLNHPERAAEAYRLIVSSDSAPPEGARLSETLTSVRSMAEWRLKNLDWVEDYGKRLQILMAENTAN